MLNDKIHLLFFDWLSKFLKKTVTSLINQLSKISMFFFYLRSNKKNSRRRKSDSIKILNNVNKKTFNGSFWWWKIQEFSSSMFKRKKKNLRSTWFDQIDQFLNVRKSFRFRVSFIIIIERERDYIISLKKDF